MYKELLVTGLVLAAGCQSSSGTKGTAASEQSQRSINNSSAGGATHENRRVLPASSVSAPPPLPSDDPAQSAAGEVAARFATKLGTLIQGQQSDPGQSWVYSPAALLAALGLAHAGARGQTRAELAALLGVTPEESASVLASVATLVPEQQSGAFRLQRALAVWSPPNLSFTRDFSTTVKHFGAQLLHSNSESAADTINAWVRGATQQRILELLPPTEVPDAPLVFASALDFAGAWAVPFDPALTAPREFMTARGKRLQMATLARVGAVPAVLSATHQAVSLALAGGEYQLVLIGPAAGVEVTPDALLSSLPEVTTSFKGLYARLEAPKFRVRSALNLNAALRAGGVTTAPSGAADFSGMASEPAFLDDVFHAAELEIDERGLRGSAATAIAVPPASIPPKPVLLKFNRPFAFYLRSARTNAVLLAGVFAG